MESPYLKEKEVADLLKCKVQTLRNHRHLGRGLPYIKHGRGVLYHRDDIGSHLAARKVVPAEG